MRKIIFICIIITLLISALFLFSLKKDKGLQEDKVSESSSEKYFTEEEKHIIDLIYNKSNILDYFDQNNLESFEIEKVIPFGYFESKSNIRYYQINYDFKCKDGTRKCNLLDEFIDFKDILFAFHIAIDLNNEEYIEIDPEFTIHINSDWIAT